ncbi:MAG: hypothetical protein HQL63_09570 [Magnetococcales bacterium]|nr:hypothetical protein [Magnetococcales bacterium]
MNRHVSPPGNHPGSTSHARQGKESLQELLGVVDSWALTQSQLWFTKFADLLTQYLGEAGKALGQQVDLDTITQAIKAQENSFNATVSQLIRKSFAETTSTPAAARQPLPPTSETTHPSLPRATRAHATLPPSLGVQKGIQRKSTHAPAPDFSPADFPAATGPVQRSDRTQWKLPPDPDKKGDRGRIRSTPALPLPPARESAPVDLDQKEDEGKIRWTPASPPPPARESPPANFDKDKKEDEGKIRWTPASPPPPARESPPANFDKDKKEDEGKIRWTPASPPPPVRESPPADSPAHNGVLELLLGILKSVLGKLNAVRREETHALAATVSMAMETLQATGGDMGDPRNQEALQAIGAAFNGLRNDGLDHIPEMEGLGSALEKITMFFGTPPAHEVDTGSEFSHPDSNEAGATPLAYHREVDSSGPQAGVTTGPSDPAGSTFPTVLHDFFSGPGKRPATHKWQQG